MTTLRDSEAIRRALGGYRNFEECLLREVRLTQQMTRLDLEFAYVWSRVGSEQWVITDEPSTVVLHLGRLELVTIRPELSSAIREDPKRADWGLTEIAVLRLEDGGDGMSNHRLMVLWEDGRSIDVVFGELEISDSDPQAGVSP